MLNHTDINNNGKLLAPVVLKMKEEVVIALQRLSGIWSCR
jgi:hypothetical protein